MKSWNTVFDTPSVSKACFYNYRVSDPGADKTFTDGVINMDYYSQTSFGHRFKKFRRSAEKNDAAKIKKSGPAKAIFGQNSGPAMAGPAVPPTTALHKS